MKQISCLILLPILVFACQPSNDEKPVPAAQSQRDSITSDKNFEKHAEVIFKKWLNDTLQTLASSDQNDKNIVDFQITVAKDSLMLRLNTFFSSTIAGIDPTNKASIGVVGLLKEYKEEFALTDTLSINQQMTFFPCEIESLKYDFVYELVSIEVRSANRFTSYNYIRGGLSSKKMYQLKNGSFIKTSETDFIWNGNQLTKSKVS